MDLQVVFIERSLNRPSCLSNVKLSASALDAVNLRFMKCGFRTRVELLLHILCVLSLQEN